MAASLERALRAVESSNDKTLTVFADKLRAREFHEILALGQKPQFAKNPIANAICALAMSFNGQYNDGIAQVQKLVANGDVDNYFVASIVAEVFERRYMRSEKRQMFEAAVKKHPDSVEFAKQLFFCYIADEDYNSQKLLAMKMFKAGHQIFGTWAATALLMNIAADPHAKNTNMLALFARKLLDKSTAGTESISVGETNRLYIELLIESNEFEAAFNKLGLLLEARENQAAEAAAGIDGEEAGKLSLYEILQYQATCLEKTKRYKEAQLLHLRHLRELDSDAWDHYDSLIRCSFDPELNDAEMLEGCRGMSGDDILKFIRDQQASSSSLGTKLLRGPFLAEVHFFYYCLINPESHPSLPQLQRNAGGQSSVRGDLEAAFIDALEGYINKFGSKGCCFDDLSTYLKAIKSDSSILSEFASKKFAGFLQQEVSANKCSFSSMQELAQHIEQGETETGPAAIKVHKQKLCKYICAQKIRRSLRTDDITGHGNQIVQELLHEYETTLALNSVGVGGQREVQVGDDLLLLAAHYVLDGAKGTTSASGWQDGVSQQRRLEAIDMLEIGHAQSPHNYQMRLLLVRLYNEVAALPRALELFELFDVKHVQLDTLTQLIVPDLARNGFTDHLEHLAMETMLFHSRAGDEVADYIRTAFENRNFTKAVELVKFRQRLQNSRQKVVCEAHLLSGRMRRQIKDLNLFLKNHLMKGDSSLLTMSNADFDRLRDNVDTEIAVSWDLQPPVVSSDAQSDAEVELRSPLLLARMQLWVHESNTAAVENVVSDFQTLVATSSAGRAFPELFDDFGRSLSPIQLASKLRDCSSACFQLYCSSLIVALFQSLASKDIASAQSLAESTLAHVLRNFLPATGEALPLLGTLGSLSEIDLDALGLNDESDSASKESDSDPLNAALAQMFKQTTGASKTWVLFREFGTWISILLPQLYQKFPKVAPPPVATKKGKGKGRSKGRNKGKSRGKGKASGKLAGIHKHIADTAQDMESRFSRATKHMKYIAGSIFGPGRSLDHKSWGTYAPSSIVRLAATAHSSGTASGSSEQPDTGLTYIVNGLKMTLSRLSNQCRDVCIVFKGMKFK